jgi:SAM-dependent methyltransferase
MLGNQALERLIDRYPVGNVVDIGTGDGKAAQRLRDAGWNVTTVDVAGDPDVKANFPRDWTPPELVDAIWCCHALEHQENPMEFLRACYDSLKVGGVLAVTVPPFVRVVAGHITAWTGGLLLYNVVLAGFDCSDAAISEYGYNVSIIAEKREHRTVNVIGPLDGMEHYFPVPLVRPQGMFAQLPMHIEAVNW